MNISDKFLFVNLDWEASNNAACGCGVYRETHRAGGTRTDIAAICYEDMTSCPYFLNKKTFTQSNEKMFEIVGSNPTGGMDICLL